jgi:hypothetical protein
MLNENLLWARTISPTGKIVKEETFLGAALTFIVFAGGSIALIALAHHFGLL